MQSIPKEHASIKEHKNARMSTPDCTVIPRRGNRGQSGDIRVHWSMDVRQQGDDLGTAGEEMNKDKARHVRKERGLSRIMIYSNCTEGRNT